MLKKKSSFLALQFVTMVTCLPLCASIPSQPSQEPHQFSLGLELFYYKYREPRVMELKGLFYGGNTAYNYTFCDNFFLQPDFRFSYGRANYKSYETGSMKSIPNWLVETRFVFGKRFKLASTTEFDPYVGVGYRYKTDNSDGKKSTTDHRGYRRKSQYLYIPLGVTLHQQLTCDWTLSPTAEFDWFLHGWQHSYVFKNTPKRGLQHHQKKGYGLKGDLMLTKKFINSSLSFGPFINYWNIKDSNVVKLVDSKNRIVGTTLEPHNKTIEAGLKVQYNF